MLPYGKFNLKKKRPLSNQGICLDVKSPRSAKYRLAVKIGKKSWEKNLKNKVKKPKRYYLTCLKIWVFLRILKNFHLRLTLKNPQKLRWGWEQHLWGWDWNSWVLLHGRNRGFLRIKPKKTLKFWGEDEASIFEEFYHPTV